VQRDTSPRSAPLAFFTFMMLLAPVTNWEPNGVTLVGYSYARRHETEVQIVTPFRVSHLKRYGVTVRGNVTSVYPPKVRFMLFFPTKTRSHMLSFLVFRLKFCVHF
jgi:hypothetical protein